MPSNLSIDLCLFVVNVDVVLTCNQTTTALLYVTVDLNTAGSKKLHLVLFIYVVY